MWYGTKKSSEESLATFYYNPSYGYTGVNALVRKRILPKATVENWLSKQKVYTLHKIIKHRFKTRQVIFSHIDDQWQADLVDMQKYKQHNKYMNFILTVIDIFSKYAWAIPIKRKTGEKITKAFRKIFEFRSPKKLQTDKGLEFINKDTQSLFRKYVIIWFSTENETKAQVVERYNRTLKTKRFDTLLT